MKQFFDWIAESGVVILITVVVAFLLAVVGSYALSYLVRRAVATRGRNWQQRDIEKRSKTLVGLFSNVWKGLVAAGATLFLVSVFFPHVNLAPLFASAGIVGVAFGFGAQSLVKDFLSGIFIISENQYRVGDIIEIEGFSGTVERITTRSTVLRDVDGNVHYFPNGMIQHVINKTMGYSMARLTIGVAPNTDVDSLVEKINEIGQSMVDDKKWKSKIIDAPHFVTMGDFTATNLELVISGKTQPSDQWSVTSELRRRIFDMLEDEKIQLGTQNPFASNSKQKK